MARIAGVDLPRDKAIGISLTYIFGIGRVSAVKICEEAGVPAVPGSDGLIADLDAACALAEEIAFPVFIKAAAGGGGRGIRVA